MEGPEFHHIDRYIGDSEVIEGSLQQREEMWKRRIRVVEVGKIPREEAMIDLIDRISTETAEAYGRQTPIRVGALRIHLIQKEKASAFFGNGDNRGRYSDFGHAVVARESSEIQTALTIFHEMMHMKSYQALKTAKDGKVHIYRGGFRTAIRNGKEAVFNDFNEAVVSELTLRFYRDVVLKHPFFRESVKDQEASPEISRKNEREELKMLCADIALRNNNQFRSSDDVKNIFIRAGLTGNILPVARLIEETYGAGSFRELAATDTSEEFLDAMANDKAS